MIFRFWRRLAGCALWGVILALTLGVSSIGTETTAREPVAEVNGEAITAEDLEWAFEARLRQLEKPLYNLKRRELEALIAERLLAQEAAKREISVRALLDTEVTAKVEAVTEQEIDAFYQANKARLRGEEADIRQRIRTYLEQQKLSARRERFVGSLRAQAKILVWLQPPPRVRVKVPIEGAPVSGPAEAQ
jgi:hypothetical protein